MHNELEYIKNNLKQEDLKPTQQALLEMLGIEKYLEVCAALGGSTVYITKLESLIQLIAKRKVLEKKMLFNSKKISRSELAAMYGISESTIYNILKGENK